MGKKRHFKGNNRAEDKRQRRENAEKWRNSRGDESNKRDWILENKRFDAFYKAMNFIRDDEDWGKFIHHLQTPLPACFRICPDYAFADELRNQMLSFAGQTLEHDGMQIQSAEQLPWYPNGFGYKLGTDRRTIRKLDALNDLHKWMMRHTDNGNITRQEAVSMVPPLALDVKPHHRCLDMCASPGSKTSQLLEVINRSLMSPEDQQGLVVANDSDTDRAYMLVHQCKRIDSPFLVVTTHKGQLFPSIVDPVDTNDKPKAEFFDRVLCDVPCSGDGTLRKNPTIWTKWCTSMSFVLHPLQLMIAQRGLQVLKVGALMVYSTCSMSPYEDEAVVAELLRSSNGTLELVDARQFLPLFRCRDGLSSWYVLDDYGAIRKTAQERKANKAAAAELIAAAATIAAEVTTGVAGTAATGTLDDAAATSMDTGGTVDDFTTITAAATTTTAASSSAADTGTTATAAATVASEAAAVEDFSHVADLSLRHCLEMGMTHYPTPESVPEHLRRKVRRSMFPPSEEEKTWMHLERCLRCVPQDEDTGGFFVATLRKVAPDSTTGINTTSIPTPTSVAADRGDDNVVDNAEETAAAVLEEAAAVAAAVEDAGPSPATGGGTIEAVPTNAASADLQDQTREEENADTSARASGSGPSTTSATAATVRSSQKGLVDYHQWEEEDFAKIREFYGVLPELSAESFFTREDFVTSSRADGGRQSISAKSVYYMPKSVRNLMRGDRDRRLKVVTAGVKAFEKKILRSGATDYRLLQDGIPFLAPYITKRKLQVTIQDLCNMLQGGLVSMQTLSPGVVKCLEDNYSGVVICTYTYHPDDTVTTTPATTTTANATTIVTANDTAADAANDASSSSSSTAAAAAAAAAPESNTATTTTSTTTSAIPDHKFYVMCWKGASRAVNVMCGKVDMESMKHQLDALKVWRPKIAAPKLPGSDASATVTAEDEKDATVGKDEITSVVCSAGDATTTEVAMDH